MMENNNLLVIDTAWPFPIIQYTANVSYVEVRKASGIAYILLQLISTSNSEKNFEKLVTILKNLGVPSDIHHIFTTELFNMINYNIIEMRNGSYFNSDLINTYAISDFKITNLGKKLFIEGAIPTGNTNIKPLSLYYDVSKKDILIKPNMKLFQLESSTIDEKCIGDIVLNNLDVELYIKENMKNEFKKGERITEFNHEEPVILVYKVDDIVELKITSDTLKIKAKNKVQDEFIHQNYSIDTIMKIMDIKKKYHFPDKIKIREYYLEQLPGIVKLSIPSQLMEILEVKNELSLSLDYDLKKSEYKIEKNMVNDLMQECNIKGIACYFANSKLFSIIPGRFFINVEGYSEKCPINLIAIQENSEEIGIQLMRQIFLKCIDKINTFEYCDLIKRITRISKCKDYIEQFSILELNKKQSYVDKILIFFKLNDSFSEMNEWGSFSKCYGEKLLEELCNQVSKSEFVTQDSLGNKLRKIIGLSEREYLLKISKNLIKDEGKVGAFEILEEANYNVDTILNIINVFEIYCKEILNEKYIISNSKFGKLCSHFGSLLLELNKITGIKSPYDSFNELDFNNDDFLKIIVKFMEAFSKIMKYKIYALEQYKVFEAFKDRYTEVKNIFIIEKEALKNPKNINNDYIKHRLKKLRYKEAICDLHIRLQYELNRLFGVNNKATYELLLNDNIYKYLTEKEIIEMNLLRKCRNNFQHPKGRNNISYSEEKIMQWYNIVEKLGGME